MILYKYVSFAGGLEILKNNSIGFRRPCDFNDPFECSSATTLPDVIDNTGNHVDKPLNEAFSKLDHQDAYAQQTCVLSMTRNPMNPLMWSHYGCEHTGMVIGIDVSMNVQLIEEWLCTLPAQYGNVIYTATKPSYDSLVKRKILKDTPLIGCFVSTNLEILQRALLYKDACWSYEEEVRVVKPLYVHEWETIPSSRSGSMKLVISANPQLAPLYTQIDVGGKPLYLVDLEPESIKEVYFGYKFHSELKGKQVDEIMKLQPQASHSHVKPVLSSWQLKATEF